MAHRLAIRRISHRVAGRTMLTAAKWNPTAISNTNVQQLRRNMVMVTQTKAGSPEDIARDVQEPILTDEQSSLVNNDMIITARCFARIRALAEKRSESLNDVYLRVYVDAGGCSGFQYKFELTRDEDEAVDDDDDVVFSQNDVRVVIDKTSLNLLKGSTIDFVQEMIKSAFAVVDNPQSESACGCGSSFAVKNFEANPALD